MDHQLGAFHGSQYDHLKHVGRAIRAEHEPAVWFLADVLDDKRMVDRVKDVLVGDAVLACRAVDLPAE
ncbi:MAG: hypothetical protein WBD40_09580 [Tepidisphaeraceae bacterium]